MDTNDLRDRASKLLRALEDGDSQRARDMLHGEDALDVALMLSLHYHLCDSVTLKTGRELLAILAAERMARDVLKRATGMDEIERYKYTPDPRAEPAREDALEAEIARGIVRSLAALGHGRAVADLYDDGDGARMEALERCKKAKVENLRDQIERMKSSGELKRVAMDDPTYSLFSAIQDHSRAIADMYDDGSDEDVEARR